MGCLTSRNFSEPFFDVLFCFILLSLSRLGRCFTCLVSYLGRTISFFLEKNSGYSTVHYVSLD